MLIGHDFSMDDEVPPDPIPAAPRPPGPPARGPDPLARKVEGFLEARRLKLEGHLQQKERRPVGGPLPSGAVEAGPIPTEADDVPPPPPRDFAARADEPSSPATPELVSEPGVGPLAVRGRDPANPEDRELPVPAGARPMVVIERRGNGWMRGLIPPALVLAVAGSILAFRVREPDWSGLGPDLPMAPAGADAPADLASPSPVAPPGPVVARARADEAPVPPEPTAIEPVEPTAKDAPLAATPAAPDPSPAGPPPLIAPVEPTPLIAEADAFAEPPPAEKPVPKEETLRDIRREAARKAAERDRNEDLKIRAAAREQAETRRRRAEQVKRSEHFVEEDRSTFRHELLRILRAGGPRMGTEVEDLCRQHKQVLPMPIEKAFKQAQLTVAAKLQRRKRVELYRKLGVPEPRILYELANDELPSVGRRNGLRNRSEVLVVAARRLLEVPLPDSGPVADAEMPPGRAPADRPR